MSDFEDLDDVFGALRSAATPSELSAETGMVDLMTSNHRATRGATTMFTSRRSRVAVLIAAGVIGFGGVAAAGPGGFDLLDSEPAVTTTTEPVDVTTTTEAVDVTTTTEAVEVTTTTVLVDDAMVEPAAVEPDAVDEATTPVDDPATDFFDESTCLPGNHGKTVSAVARGDERFEGIEVRDAARSSCGKDDDESEAVEDDSDEVEVDDDSDEVEVDDESDDEEDSSEDHDEERSGKGAGNQQTGNRGGGHGKSGKDD